MFSAATQIPCGGQTEVASLEVSAISEVAGTEICTGFWCAEEGTLEAPRLPIEPRGVPLAIHNERRSGAPDRRRASRTGRRSSDPAPLCPACSCPLAPGTLHSNSAECAKALRAAGPGGMQTACPSCHSARIEPRLPIEASLTYYCHECGGQWTVPTERRAPASPRSKPEEDF